MKKNSFTIALLIFFAMAGPAALAADDFRCEVLSMNGTANATDKDGKKRALKEGDMISKGELVEADASSYVDLSFDKEWKNVSRVEASSKAKVISIYPADIKLERGAIFAKLKNLPKGSSFNVSTPTATATVRGTEYRTLFKDGQTQVFNVSPTTSNVYVYGMGADGKVDMKQEVLLQPSTKTQVVKAGETPKPPSVISSDDASVAKAIQSSIEEKVKAAEASGRVSKIQSIADLESSKTSSGAEEYSRVNDTRRRAFKGTAGE